MSPGSANLPGHTSHRIRLAARVAVLVLLALNAGMAVLLLATRGLSWWLAIPATAVTGCGLSWWRSRRYEDEITRHHAAMAALQRLPYVPTQGTEHHR